MEGERTIMQRPQKIQVRGLLLYALTVVLEVPVIAVRWVLVVIVGTIISAVGPTISGNVLLLIAVAPTLWSIFALISPAGSGWWWRQHTGGREPSQREQLAYQDAVEHLQAKSLEPLPLPKGWFVLDLNEPDGGVVGNALMLSRGLLEMSVAAVLGHELRHLGSLDGRITLGLNRLIIRPPKITTAEEQEQQQQGSGVLVVAKDPVLLALLALRAFLWLVGKAIRFAKGGLGLWLTTPLWGRYWRAREYDADHYAATLGQADELADFLEVHALLYDRPIPYMGLTDTDHDFTELRIDRLRNYRYEPTGDTTQPATA
ncbi:MAG TPA: M48 family metalloprotease [Solirubrobacteraceae bacterium]|jgi:Zn-dependent protease with chaperone function|nr:M48 family metalloprotease [Solirubrobacteraceae bacterium]